MDTRRGMTGLETAIILVAFVITAAAFAFVVLNMGFLTAEKAQSVISAGMTEASSSLLIDSGLIGQFDNVTGAQANVALVKLTFYLKLSQGHEPIDLSDDKLVATYTNERSHGAIYSTAVTNGTVMTIRGVNSDGDKLLEVGEKFRVIIDFTAMASADMDPSDVDLYARPYESFRVELRPATGAVLTIARQIPAVYTTIMVLD